MQHKNRILLVASCFLMAISMASCSRKSSYSLTIQQASSKEEIVSLLEEAASKNNNYYRTGSGDFLSATDNQITATLEDSSHSTTNVQVEGVDEGDIIKVDDDYIYTLTSQGLTITQAVSGELSIVYQEAFSNYVPQEMYIIDQYLILIGGIYETFQYEGKTGDQAIEPGISLYCWFGYQKTNILVYQIENRSQPILEKELTILGSYYTSRRIEDTFYFFSEYYFYHYNSIDTPVIPTIQDSEVNDGTTYELDPSDIYFYPDLLSSYYFLIGKFSLSDLSQESEIKGYLGLQGTIYVSPEYVYLAAYDNDYNHYNIMGIYTYTYVTHTRISKIALSTLELLATTRVEGNIKDRFSLDEYAGYLRIATTTSDWSEQTNSLYSNVFILDENLIKVGQIDRIADGERLYSVRFNQEEGVLVTFRQVDPLFKLDLSNPSHPSISLGLKEDGVSMYLHYIEGTDYVLGLGYDTETTPSGATIWKGIKLSLYDNSGDEAVNISTVTLAGAWSYAEALYNPKAILYDATRGIFAFAAEEWVSGENYQYTQLRQGLYVFSYSDGDLSDYQYLTNFEAGIVYNNWYDYYDNYYSSVRRGARIGDYIYTISEKYIASYTLSDYQLIQRIEIGTFPSFADLYLVD